MSGWSTSRLPNALRWRGVVQSPAPPPAACPRRADARSRGACGFTISMMVGTPRPSSPTMRAQAPSNSTSLDAFERLPSLSFRRWRWKRLRVPSGRQRGSRKHDRPRSVCASTRKASHIGAEQNHLWPVSSYSPPGPPRPSARARVVFARTSEPPCFSVIAMPTSAPGLVGGGTNARVVVGRRRCAAPTPPPARAGRAAPAPPSRSSRWDSRARPRPARARRTARRARRARPAADRATAARAARAATARRISSCHAGWNSTSSTRCP